MNEEYDAGARTEDTKFGESYWNSLDGGAGYTDSYVWEDLAHILQEVFAPARMLDVGCASGYLVHHMRRRGTESFGLDLSEYALGSAPGIVRPFLHKYDLTSQKMLLQSGVPADLVVCLETLEHVPEESLKVALGNLKSALTRNGMLFVSVCLDDVPGWETDPSHITIHDRKWWERTFIGAGFTDHYFTVVKLRQYRMFVKHGGLFVLTSDERW